MSKESNIEIISLKVTPSFKRMIEEFISLGIYVSKSEFIRDSIREKILKDAPMLYKKLKTGIYLNDLEK